MMNRRLIFGILAVAVRGQVAATITMFGTEILLEDSLAIASELDARIQTSSP
jgi:hypothetical protein